MAEEKVEPPNEKVGWKEIVAMRERHYYGDLIFYEFRAYSNQFFPHGLGIFSFFGGEAILKAIVVSNNLTKSNYTYFLKLENGNWVRSAINGNCDMHLEIKEEGGAAILKVIITVQMANGLQTRTLIKRTEIGRA